jgi:hypothetical protein
MSWIALLISFMVSNGAVFAAGKKWTPIDFESAIQGLNLVLEGGSWCGLTPEDARHLMLPLRPAWEDSLKELGKPSSLVNHKKQALNCKSTCTCGLWIVVFGHRRGLSPVELDRLRQSQRETTRTEREVCMKKRTDLCKSLLPEMKRIADQEFKSDAAF